MSSIVTPPEVLPKSVLFPLLIGGALMAACYGATFMLAAHLQQQGFNPTQAGTAVSAGIVVTLVSAVFAGRLAERIGLVVTVAVSAILMSLAMLGFGAASIFPAAIFGSGVFLGAGWAVFYILAPLIIIDVVSKKFRVKYLTLLSGAQMLGLGLSEPVGSFLIRTGMTYTQIYTVLGALSVVSAIIFLRIPLHRSKEVHSNLHTLTLSGAATIIRNRTAFPSIMIALLGCIFSGIATFQSLYAETRGLNASTFFLVFTVVTVILRFGIASQIARFPIYTLAMALVAIIMVSLGLLLLNDGGVLHYVFASATFAVGYGLSYSTLNAIAVNVAEAKGLSISSSSQVFTLFYFVGIFGFPFAAGQLIALASVDDMLLSLLAVCFCALCLGAYLRATNA